MENLKVEIRNRRIVALIAVFVIVFAYLVSGQTIRARGWNQFNNDYDVKSYFNMTLLVYSDNEVVETDSITVVVKEYDSTERVVFMVCEKTNLYFAYNKHYEMWVTRDGYSIAYLRINSDVKVKEYDMTVPVYLDSGNLKHNIGIVVWDTRVNSVNYHPQKIAYK